MSLSNLYVGHVCYYATSCMISKTNGAYVHTKVLNYCNGFRVVIVNYYLN
jgi:hypothetical protein